MNLVEKHSRIPGQVECPLEVCGQECKVRLVSMVVSFPSDSVQVQRRQGLGTKQGRGVRRVQPKGKGLGSGGLVQKSGNCHRPQNQEGEGGK